jgi:hypothetical protein
LVTLSFCDRIGPIPHRWPSIPLSIFPELFDTRRSE